MLFNEEVDKSKSVFTKLGARLALVIVGKVLNLNKEALAEL
jgi:hypothetical protein